MQKQKSAAPRVLKDENSGSPLYRRYETKDGETTVTKYFVAYRAVTWLPFISKDVPDTPYDGTVALRLREDALISDRIEIHAEDIYMYAGSHFKFPGKNLWLCAHRIFLIPNPNVVTELANTVQIDCSGAAGPPIDPPTLSANRGADGQIWYIYDGRPPYEKVVWDHLPPRWWVDNPVFPGSWSFASPDGATSDGATSGSDGVPGQDGTNGSDGGMVVAIGSLYSISKANQTPLSLYFNTAGGNGGNGQAGQNGGEGGNRFISNYRGFLTNQACLALLREDSKFYHYMPQDEFSNNMRNLLSRAFSSDYIRLAYANIHGGSGGVGGQPGRNGQHGKIMTFLDVDSKRGALVEYSRPNTDVAERTSHQGATGNTGPFGFQHADLSDVSEWYLPEGNQIDPTAGWGIIKGGSIEFHAPLPSPPPNDLKKFTWNYTDQDIMLQPTSSAQYRDPLHLGMIVQRLMFEYQMNFAVQSGTASDTAQTSAHEAFSTTLKWLGTAISGISGKDPTLTAQVTSGYQTLISTMQGSIDLYGFPYNKVPQANMALSAIEENIAVLEKLESSQASLFSQLNDVGSTIAQIRQQASDLLDDESAFQKTHDDLVTQMQDQIKVIQPLQDEVMEERDVLVRDLQAFWKDAQAIFARTGCTGWEGVMGAASSVLLMANKESGAQFALGGVLSLVEATSSIQLHHPDSNVDGDKILRSISAMTSDIVSQDIPQQITTIGGSAVLSDPDGNLLTVIMTDRQKFMDLCDTYFSEEGLRSVQFAKNDFNKLVDNIQTFKAAVVQYNQLVAAYLKAKADLATAKQNYTLLSLSNGNFDSQQLDLLFDFFSQAVTNQKARCLRILHSGVRAFQCAAMFPSKAFQTISELGSFDNIDSQALFVAYNQTLRSEVQDNLLSIENGQEIGNRTFLLSENSHAPQWKDFLKTGQLNITILRRYCEKFDISKKWFDVRLRGYSIYLRGAKSTSTASTNVNAYVTFSGICTIEDEAGNEHDFQFPKVTTTFSYKYTDPNNYDTMQTTLKPDPTTAEFEFQSRDGGTIRSKPLRSPFAHWKITFDDTGLVDLSGVTEIKIVMDLTVRSRDATPQSAAVHSTSQRKQVLHSSNDLFVTPSTARFHQSSLLPSPEVGGRFFSYRGFKFFLDSSIAKMTKVGGMNYTNNGSASAFSQFVRGKFPMRESRQIPSTVMQPFKNLAPTYGGIVNQFRSMKRDDRHNLLGELIEKVVNENMTAEASGVDPANLIHTIKDVDRGGHFGANAGRVVVKEDIQKRMQNPERGLVDLISSFPSYVMTIVPPDPDIQKPLDSIKGRDKVHWILEDPLGLGISKRSAALMENGGNLTGCKILLTMNSMISVEFHESFQRGDITVNHLNVITTELHEFGGMHSWIEAFHKDRPNVVFYVNLLAGDHPLVLFDHVNMTGAKLLNPHMWELAPLLMEARDRKVHTFEHAPLRFLICREFLTSMESFAGRPASAIRLCLKSNEKYDGAVNLRNPTEMTIEEIAAKRDGILVDGTPDILIDGERVSATSLVLPGNYPPSTLTDAQIQALDEITDQFARSGQSQDTIDRFTEAHDKILDDYVKDNAFDENGNPVSSEKATNDMITNTSYTTEAKIAAREIFLPDELVSNMQDALSMDDAFANSPLLLDPNVIRDVALQSGFQKIVHEVIRPEGLALTLAAAKVEALTLPAIQKINLEDILSEASASMERQSTKLEAKIQEIQKLTRDDPERIKIEEEIHIAEKAIEKAAEEVEETKRLEEQRKEPEKRQQEFEHRAKEESDRLFPEREHPGGGVERFIRRRRVKV